MKLSCLIDGISVTSTRPHEYEAFERILPPGDPPVELLIRLHVLGLSISVKCFGHRKTRNGND